jgi:hypothetical protein
MDTAEKVRENRFRRILKRRGYILIKVRRKDPLAIDYGTYFITDFNTRMVAGAEDWKRLTLNGVEDWISADAKAKRARPAKKKARRG